MRDRMPGQSVIEKLLTEHGNRPVLSAVARVFGASPIHGDDLSWHTGAVGERIVAQRLDTLAEGWHVFHSLPVGKGDSDIDHVVVGPGGIFALNSKHHSGKKIWVRDRAVWVNGQRTDYIRNSEHEADILTKLIQARYPQAPAVVPVLVFVNPKEISQRVAPKRVSIERATTIARWIRKRPAILRPEAVGLIASLLDDPSTWRPVIERDQGALIQRFDELSRGHEKARMIRAAWSVGAAAVVGGVVLFLITHVI